LTDAGVHIAPSTYYNNKSRPPSKRSIRDASIIGEIERVHKDNYGVYGIRKVHAQLAREGRASAKSAVAARRCGDTPVMR
jgi:putative transposase